MTEDDVERLSVCLRVLSERSSPILSVFSSKSGQALANMSAIKLKETSKERQVRMEIYFSIIISYLLCLEEVQVVHNRDR